MRNKFLRMTFMALCLSTSSVLHAMHEDETAACSSAASSYAGKYEIRRFSPSDPISGSVTIRQGGDHLVLENFILTEESFERSYLSAIRDLDEVPLSDQFAAEQQRRVANFVLSALPTEVIQLKFQENSEGSIHYGNPEVIVQYSAEVPFGEEGRLSMLVHFGMRKDSYFGEMFYLNIHGIGDLTSHVERFCLFKVGSAAHALLLKAPRIFTPKTDLFAPKGK